jgi:hypothetical protein
VWNRQSIPHRADGHVGQAEEVLAAAAAHSHVRQQLFQGFCGEMGAVSALRGSGNRGQTSDSGGSQFWFTDDWATVPLKTWAEERLQSQTAPLPPDPMDVRTMNAPARNTSFSKGPGYVFPTSNSMYTGPAPPARVRRGDDASGRNAALLLEVLPELNAEAAAAALTRHGGSVREALRELLGGPRL